MSNKEGVVYSVELPDFNELLDISNEIGNMRTNLLLSKFELDTLLANITQNVNSDENFWVKGKQPSMSYTESVYHVVGTNDTEREQIEKLRKDIAQFDGNLKLLENRFTVMREIINVWRTESANIRGSADGGGFI